MLTIGIIIWIIIIMIVGIPVLGWWSIGFMAVGIFFAINRTNNGKKADETVINENTPRRRTRDEIILENYKNELKKEHGEEEGERIYDEWTRRIRGEI